MATVASLMTAEEYAVHPDTHGYPTELVRGVLIKMTPPMPRHGEICARTSYLLQRFLDDHPIGRVLSNDSGVMTEHDPDTVRGADIAYYSFQRVPKGPLPAGLLSVAPELVVEVRSPSDRWSKLHVKIAEYLEAGVQAVCVLDDDSHSMHVFYPDQGSKVLTTDDDFTLPEVLGEFRVTVGRFFE